MMGSPMSPNPKNSMPIFGGGHTHPNHFVTTAAVVLRLSEALRRRFRLDFLLNSYFKRICDLGDVPQLKDLCRERAMQFTGLNLLQWSFNASPASLMGLGFFGGDKSGSKKYLGNPQSRTSRSNLFDGRQWTNILLAANRRQLQENHSSQLDKVFIAQKVSDGKLLYWGAKINGLISKGQLWRLATSSFLHANIGHLLINCYSLNSIGPTIENICGPRRYLTMYIASAVTSNASSPLQLISSAMSYWFCKASAIGASGAIFGLVASYAMFILRHRRIVKGTEGDLKHIVQVIVLNMTIGMLSQGVDNWGHVGGLIGGAAVSWLLGPAWQFESVSHGRKIFTDKAPIFSLIKRCPKSK
ncbi:hypothetical protein OROHE_018805 [Orobanche hederae]